MLGCIGFKRGAECLRLFAALLLLLLWLWLWMRGLKLLLLVLTLLAQRRPLCDGACDRLAGHTVRVGRAL